MSEVKFSADLRAAVGDCPVVTEFMDRLNLTELSQMEKLSRVASIAYRFGGLKEDRKTELVRAWMLHDPAVCHRFLVSEDRLRVEQKVLQLEKADREKSALIETLVTRVRELESELFDQEARALQEDRGAADVQSTHRDDESPEMTQDMEEYSGNAPCNGRSKRLRY